MPDKLAEIIKRASELVESVPENLREVAFGKAFDVLMQAESGGGSQTGSKKKTTRRKTSSARAHAATESTDVDQEMRSLDDLNRTEYPEINHSSSGIKNSLRLIRAARDDLGIDGLTATEIARVLTEKFRIRITKQAVSSMLNDAGQYVDRKKEGNRVVFRIMAPGEEYIDGPDDVAASPGSRKKRKTKKALKKKASHPDSNGTSRASKTSKKKAGNRRAGAAAALAQIFDEGFFSSPRTIASIIKHLQVRLGRTFKSNEMSPPLLRYLRSQKLNREKNEDGQYEYFKP
ncbi:MAG: hypothetical protein AAGL69_10375 [Pseudomonadota bacterium]